MRPSRLLATALLAAAVPAPGLAAAGGGAVGLSASPAQIRLAGRSGTVVTVRNPGRRAVVVDVSRAGFARSLHGRPRLTVAGPAAGWLRLRPRRLRIAAHGTAALRVRAAPPRGAEPGDHPALVLLTTRPAGPRRVRVRLRVGIVVDVRVPGLIVRRLEATSLTVRRHGRRRLLELRLVNRGNVTERLGGPALRLALVRGGRVLSTLRPHRCELLPHGAGVAVFAYRGRMRGAVVARIELRAPLHGPSRTFHVRL